MNQCLVSPGGAVTPRTSQAHTGSIRKCRRDEGDEEEAESTPKTQKKGLKYIKRLGLAAPVDNASCDIAPGREETNLPKFACPCWKHDPKRYSLGNWRSCALSGFPTTARVK